MKIINKNPIKKLLSDGGYTGIFRKIACVGDSLSSGEFEQIINGEKTFTDIYDYSWGQYIARMTGSQVYNFSKGGMTAKEYCESFAEERAFWDKDKKCQAYTIALGVNDIICRNWELGSKQDIDLNNYENNKQTFAGYYAKIIQKYKEISPNAKFFLISMPKGEKGNKHDELRRKHRDLLKDFCDMFSNTYLIDLYEYAPRNDDKYMKKYYLHTHLNPAGYLLSGKMIATYIDYIVKNNYEDFKEVGLFFC